MTNLHKTLKVEIRENSIDRLKMILKNKDIRISHQRLLVLDYLIKNPIHPSAEMIFKDLKDIDPLISQATVYNTLNLFVEKNLVKELDFNMPSKRYEFIKESHGHFVCTSCGHIIDLCLEDLNYSINLLDYSIDSVDITYRGLCPECRWYFKQLFKSCFFVFK